MKVFGILSFLALAFAFWPNHIAGHEMFRDAMQEKYGQINLKVNCKLCHGKKKVDRTEFGKLFEKEFKGRDYSQKYQAAKSAGNQQLLDNLESEMLEEFAKALKKIEKMESKKDGPTYGELIREIKMEHLSQDNDPESE